MSKDLLPKLIKKLEKLPLPNWKPHNCDGCYITELGGFTIELNQSMPRGGMFAFRQAYHLHVYNGELTVKEYINKKEIEPLYEKVFEYMEQEKKKGQTRQERKRKASMQELEALLQ